MVVIAGSLPPGSPEESLAHLCQAGEPPPGAGHPRREGRGHAGRARTKAPLVAKLNRGELAQTLGRELASDTK